MHLLAGGRWVKLHLDCRSHYKPLWYVEQCGLVSVITWLIKPTKSGHNDYIQLLPCFTQIMNHSFMLICYGNLVIFPLSWDRKWAIVIFLLCVCVRERWRERDGMKVTTYPSLMRSQATAQGMKVQLITIKRGDEHISAYYIQSGLKTPPTRASPCACLGVLIGCI